MTLSLTGREYVSRPQAYIVCHRLRRISIRILCEHVGIGDNLTAMCRRRTALLPLRAIPLHSVPVRSTSIRLAGARSFSPATAGLTSSTRRPFVSGCLYRFFGVIYGDELPYYIARLLTALFAAVAIPSRARVILDSELAHAGPLPLWVFTV